MRRSVKGEIIKTIKIFSFLVLMTTNCITPFDFEEWFSRIDIVNQTSKAKLHAYLIDNDYNTKSALSFLDVSTLTSFSGGVRASLSYAIENLIEPPLANESELIAKALCSIHCNLSQSHLENKQIIQGLTSNYSSLVENINTMNIQYSALTNEIATVNSNYLSIMKTIKSLNDNLNAIIPMVFRLVAEKSSLWSKSSLQEVSKEIEIKFREDLLLHLDYSPDSELLPCMISGELGNSRQVVAARIIPFKVDPRLLSAISVNPSDIFSPFNGLLLSQSIRQCFDKLQLSFISVPLSKYPCMRIWDDSCRSIPLWPESKLTVGQFDGFPLKLGNHTPFKRGLSYQAYSAYLQFSYGFHSQDEELLSEISQECKLMKEAVIKDIENEIESKESF